MRLGAVLKQRFRQCFKDNGRGDVCALPQNHTGPCGFDLPRDAEVIRSDAARRYYKLWQNQERN